MSNEVVQPVAGTTPEASGASLRDASGSAPPVERWVREHADVLWRFVLGRVRSRDDAEEVVQETMLAAMQAHATFSGASSERTWLLGIAAHKVADHFRAVRRRAGELAIAMPESEGQESADFSDMFTPAGMWAKPPKGWGLADRSTAENAELLAALRRCIEALPPSQAETVWLRDLLGIQGEEVCKAMGISSTNLWSRMHRARAALRTCVERSMGMNKEDTR